MVYVSVVGIMTSSGQLKSMVGAGRERYAAFSPVRAWSKITLGRKPMRGYQAMTSPDSGGMKVVKQRLSPSLRINDTTLARPCVRTHWESKLRSKRRENTQRER
jgi:hypothetical protein